MNYYEHHIGDYAQATFHLTFVEDAAYSRLLRKYYAEEKPLPADLRAVQRLVGARTDEEREAVSTVLDEFFTLENDGWHNKRADSEIARFVEKREKASRSARARWNANASDSDANASNKDANALDQDANAMRRPDAAHNGRNALQSPDTRHQKEQKKKTAPDGELFDGIDPVVVADFKALRNKLRAPVTKTAMAGIRREAQSAGLTVQEALAMCCERGWRGFKAEWLHDSKGRPASPTGYRPLPGEV